MHLAGVSLFEGTTDDDGTLRFSVDELRDAYRRSQFKGQQRPNTSLAGPQGTFEAEVGLPDDLLQRLADCGKTRVSVSEARRHDLIAAVIRRCSFASLDVMRAPNHK